MLCVVLLLLVSIRLVLCHFGRGLLLCVVSLLTLNYLLTIYSKDGHGPSLKAIIDKTQMSKEEALKVLACKHASSTSSIVQSADIGRQFAIVKALSKTTSSVNLPHGFGMKGFLEDVFDDHKARGVLILKLPARKAIIDHIVSCPRIFGRAMSPKTTKKGFIVNGMIDDKTETYPDIIKMLQTCKQEIPKEQEDLVFHNFSELYSIMKKDGHITEDVYDRLGFMQDTNYDGDIVLKPDGVTQEMRHRAKILRYFVSAISFSLYKPFFTMISFTPFCCISTAPISSVNFAKRKRLMQLLISNKKE